MRFRTQSDVPHLKCPATEQYVDPGSSGTNAGRVFVETDASFDQTTTAYNLLSDLAQLRRDSLGLTYGPTNVLHSSDDTIVYEREFYDHVAVVAINRQPSQSESVPPLGTQLPDDAYDDYLGGPIYGQSNTVSGGRLNGFTLGGAKLASGLRTQTWTHQFPASGRQ